MTFMNCKKSAYAQCVSFWKTHVFESEKKISNGSVARCSYSRNRAKNLPTQKFQPHTRLAFERFAVQTNCKMFQHENFSLDDFAACQKAK